MSDYIYDPNSLYHYGVLGMRWGVHNAVKAYGKASTASERSSALKKMAKHKVKATKKIAKLDAQNVKLQKKRDSQKIHGDVKAAKLYNEAARLERKAYGRFTSQSKSEKLMFKSNKIKAKADSIAAKSKQTQAMIDKNDALKKQFSKGISDIDSAVTAKGKQELNRLVDKLS